MTSKLAQIVLMDNNYNLCKGIRRKYKIEHKQEKCDIMLVHIYGKKEETWCQHMTFCLTKEYSYVRKTFFQVIREH